MRKILLSLLLIILFGHFQVTGAPTSEEAPSGPETRPVVIAYPDSGINPYHIDFREPTWQAHPSTYIPGYPEDARPLDLTLDAATYEEAVEQDADVWASIEPEVLYYVPGTRIVAMRYPDPWNIQMLDQGGHGTAVASAGSGGILGIAGNTAIAAVGFTGAYHWIIESEWVDITTVSHGCLIPLLGGAYVDQDIPIIGDVETRLRSMAVASYRITAEGRMYFNAAGNGLHQYNGWCDKMPPWVVVVGQAILYHQPGSEQRARNNDAPFELMAMSIRETAYYRSIDETETSQGTSIASPMVAGYAALLIEKARHVLDHNNGVVDGKLATLGPTGSVPEKGPLADGDLTASEVQSLLYAAARSIPLHYHEWNATPEELDYLENGYGMIDEAAYDEAEAVLLGLSEPRSRPYHDFWHHHIEGLAWQYWYPLVCLGDRDPTDWAECRDHKGTHYDPLAYNPFLP